LIVIVQLIDLVELSLLEGQKRLDVALEEG